MDELVKLPTDYSRQVIRRIADEMELSDCNVTVTEGSAKGENFIGDVYKVKLLGVARRDGRVETTSLIIKFASCDVAFRQCCPVESYFLREIAAYAKILPAFERLQDSLSVPPDSRFNAARCRALDDKPFREMVMMDDLSVDGFRLYDKLVSLDYDHAALAVKCLANYHALSFVMRQKDPDGFKQLAESASQNFDYGVNTRKFVERNKNVLLGLFNGNELYEKLRSYLSNVYEKMEKLTDPTRTEPYNVICHGDCWTSNFLFKYENETVIDIRMVDWQGIRLASPAIDLGYIMFTSVDEAWRSEYFYKTLDLYYDSLGSNITMMGYDINKCYPRDIFDQHMKSILQFGLLIGILVCPVILCDRDVPIPSLATENEKFSSGKEFTYSFSKTPAERLSGGVRDLFKFGLFDK